MLSGTLYLIPCSAHESNPYILLPAYLEILPTIRLFIVENTRTARRFLKSILPEFDINACTFYEIDKHDVHQLFNEAWSQVLGGQDLGLMSEAGSPCIADPGSKIVAEAHRKNIPVRPWIGPTSLTLALMASGLNGQHFTFHGYLPSKSKEELSKKLKTLEQVAWTSGYSQLIIETPYRNNSLLDAMFQYFRDDTMLTLAIDLTAPTELILTKSIATWKKSSLPDVQKRPIIFIFNRPTIDE